MSLHELSNAHFDRFVNLQAVPAAGVREHPAYDAAYYNFGAGKVQMGAAPVDVAFKLNARSTRQRLRQNSTWVREQENKLWAAHGTIALL